MIAALVAAGGLVAGGAAMARPRCLPATRATAADSSRAPNSRAGISIVIPARNAETTIVQLLGSLERVHVAEVIVVDDASTDATAALAAAHGAEVVRLDGDPPAGWTGKAHACHRGAAVATAPVLLFLDADVTMREGAIVGLLDAHAHHGGLISVQPYHRIERPYETLSAVCNVMAIMRSAIRSTSGSGDDGPPRSSSSARRSLWRRSRRTWSMMRRLVIPTNHPASVPRAGSNWSRARQALTKTSWVTSRAASSPSVRRQIPKTSEPWAS